MIAVRRMLFGVGVAVVMAVPLGARMAPEIVSYTDGVTPCRAVITAPALPSEYYAIEMVPTRRVPGTGRALGTGTVQLVYDKSDWVVLEPVQSASVVSWVRGDVAASSGAQTIVNSPLLVSVPVGTGRVFFMTFHTHQQVNSQMTDILRHIIFEL